MYFDKNLDLAKAVAEKIAPKGGKVYLVGGIVRDEFLNRENKDVDIEVHFPKPFGYDEMNENEKSKKRKECIAEFEADLRTFLKEGKSLSLVGSSFGVYRIGHYDVDITLPRTEKAIGMGHKDFDVSVDPFLDCETAAKRRDFTMNAMMKDVVTGEILDFFGGLDDIKEKKIRHVNDETFQEDPLRVLRAAQFAARFGFSIADETRELSTAMDISTVVKERIMGEMEKALLKAERPSIFFEELRKMNHLNVWFPELKALIGVEQSPKYHPEGDVWTHTSLVLDEAAKLREQAKHKREFMFAALLHDVGKPATTTVDANGNIRSLEHEKEGVAVAKEFLARLTNEKGLTAYVLDLVRSHMRPNRTFENNSKLKATRKMFDETKHPEDLLLLAKADHLGRKDALSYDEAEEFLNKRLADYREIMSRPQVTGKDLLEIGFKPGELLGRALEKAHKMHLSGMDKEEVVRQICGMRTAIEKEMRKNRAEESLER